MDLISLLVYRELVKGQMLLEIVWGGREQWVWRKILARSLAVDLGGDGETAGRELTDHANPSVLARARIKCGS